jgi:hypothetical protein
VRASLQIAVVSSFFSFLLAQPRLRSFLRRRMLRGYSGQAEGVAELGGEGGGAIIKLLLRAKENVFGSSNVSLAWIRRRRRCRHRSHAYMCGQCPPSTRSGTALSASTATSYRYSKGQHFDFFCSSAEAKLEGLFLVQLLPARGSAEMKRQRKRLRRRTGGVCDAFLTARPCWP